MMKPKSYGNGQKKHHTCPVKVLLMITLAAHFYFLYKYHHALVDFEVKGGKLTSKWCHQEKKEKTIKRQSNVLAYSIVDHDKEFSEVVAPQPQVQTYRVDNQPQQMV
jgi:hypothetical protein